MVTKITRWSFLQPFLNTRETLHLLDISRKLKQNHATVRKYLNEFVKEGFLKKNQKARLTLYELNLDHSLLIDYICIAEKEFLIKKCSEERILKELIFNLKEQTNKPLLIFGSSVENFAKANDLDIVCLEEIKTEELEKKYHKKIQTITVSHLNEIKEPLRKEIIKKHIILGGTEEVIRWLI